MSQESTTSEVNDFLLRIKELDQKTSREDELRAKKLEQDILDGKRKRQELRQRSRSPIKNTISNVSSTKQSIMPSKTIDIVSNDNNNNIDTIKSQPKQRIISRKEMEIKQQIDNIVGPNGTLSISLNNISFSDDNNIKSQTETASISHEKSNSNISTSKDHILRHSNSMQVDKNSFDIITPSKSSFNSTNTPKTAPQLNENYDPFQSPQQSSTSPSSTKLSRSPTRGGSFIKSALLKRESRQKDDISSRTSPVWKSPNHFSSAYDSPPLTRSSETFGLSRSDSQWSTGKMNRGDNRSDIRVDKEEKQDSPIIQRYSGQSNGGERNSPSYTMSQVKYGLNQENYGLTQEKYGLNQEKHGYLNQEKKNVDQERNSLVDHEKPYHVDREKHEIMKEIRDGRNEERRDAWNSEKRDTMNSEKHDNYENAEKHEKDEFSYSSEKRVNMNLENRGIYPKQSFHDLNKSDDLKKSNDLNKSNNLNKSDNLYNPISISKPSGISKPSDLYKSNDLKDHERPSFTEKTNEKLINSSFSPSPTKENTEISKNDELFYRGRPGSTAKWSPEKKKTWLESALTRKPTDAKSRSPSPVKSFAESKRPRSVVLPGAGGIYSPSSPMVSINGRTPTNENTRNTLSYAGISSPRLKGSDSPFFSGNYKDFSPERPTTSYSETRSPLRANTTGNGITGNGFTSSGFTSNGITGSGITGDRITRTNSHSRTTSDITGALSNSRIESLGTRTPTRTLSPAKTSPVRTTPPRISSPKTSLSKTSPPSTSPPKTFSPIEKPSISSKMEFTKISLKSPSLKNPEPEDLAPALLRRATLKSVPPKPSKDSKPTAEAIEKLRGLKSTSTMKSPARDELREALDNVRENLKKGNIEKTQPRDELKDALGSVKGSLRKSNTVKYQAPDEFKEAVLSTKGSLRRSPVRGLDNHSETETSSFGRSISTKTETNDSKSIQDRLNQVLKHGPRVLDRSNTDSLIDTGDECPIESIKRSSTFESTATSIATPTKLNHMTKGRAKGPKRRLPTDERKEMTVNDREKTLALGESQSINIVKKNDLEGKKTVPMKPRKPSSSVRMINV